MDHQLIPATPADFERIYRLCEATMRGYVEADLGDCFEKVARPALATLLKEGWFSTVHVGGDFVGAVAVAHRRDHCQLEELYIAPDHQNRGLGAAIVRHLMAQAAARRQPVRLHVLASNRARAFYERLGFWVTRSNRAVTYMEWSAAGPTARPPAPAPAG